jgi:hypothetical protein
VALADAGRDGEIRYMGEFDASPESMTRLIKKLAASRSCRFPLAIRQAREAEQPERIAIDQLMTPCSVPAAVFGVATTTRNRTRAMVVSVCSATMSSTAGRCVAHRAN